MNTIEEGNKIIAEFMEEDLSFPYDYNISWDWLMPVVEKIENLEGGYYFKIEYITVSVHNTDILYNCPPATIGVNAKDKINAVWLAVVDFINWYNQQTK